MHTLAAFYSSRTAAATNEAIAAVNDQVIPQDLNGKFILPQRRQIIAAHALGANVTGFRINAPSLRTLSVPSLQPYEIGTVEPSLAAMMLPMWQGLYVQANEGLAVEDTHTGTGPDNVFAGLWLASAQDQAPPGPIYTIRATASVTLTLGTWVAAPITLEQVLPAGTYTVVGMEVECPGCCFARLIFPGYTTERPGVVALPSNGSKTLYNQFRFGNMGVYGVFTNTAQPQVEFLGNTAGAQTPQIYLDIIKTG